MSNLVYYCNDNNINIDKVYSDISSGIDLDRPAFSKLLEKIFNNRIDTIYITYKDRLTRLSYLTLESVINKFGTKIVVLNESNKDDYGELFDEITSLMHYFSTKKYSNRRKFTKHKKKKKKKQRYIQLRFEHSSKMKLPRES